MTSVHTLEVGVKRVVALLMRLDDRLLCSSDGRLRARGQPPLPGKVAVAGVAATAFGVSFLLGSWFWWPMPQLTPFPRVVRGPRTGQR